MDFFKVNMRNTKNSGYIVEPTFIVGRHSDFMVRGKNFYAVWDEENGLWCKDSYRVSQLVDKELFAFREELAKSTDQKITVLTMQEFGDSWKSFSRYLSLISDSYHELDRSIRFSNDEVRKEDYASFKLDYPLLDSPCPNYNKIMSTLYDPYEREKLEWAIGAVISGDAKDIQKFIVLTGEAGSGKSTFLNIVQMLFGDYCKSFEAKELGMVNNQFSTEAFKDNPLVAIQQDGDLSRINDNTKLNSIISHDRMLIHEKHKPSYEIKLDTFLFVGSNSPVKITDSRSGIIRRLIDVKPSGRLLPIDEYTKAVDQIKFELSGIAWHCLQVYKSMGKHAYINYNPIDMLYKTNTFYNFIDEYCLEFQKADWINLTQAWDWYKQYCDSGGYTRDLTISQVREELKEYFDHYYPITRVDGVQKRSIYTGFRASRFLVNIEQNQTDSMLNGTYEETLVLDSTESEIDILFADCPAQYASDEENQVPLRKWENVTTTLKELDTTKVHYILFPEEFKNHIVVDFDLKDDEGNKSAELNLKEAAKWPATYAEFSKGGAGIHLHYIYDGDTSKLSALYAPGIEIKVFSGKSSLRRRLTYCNELPVAHISSGLPLKEEKKVVNVNRVMSEKGLRDLIERNLRKEIHAATKPSVDFIYRILEDAYNGGMVYDVTDMRSKILAFAARSTHQADYCIRLVSKMQFKSEEEPTDTENGIEGDPMVFYDVEVFPNLFIVCWKVAGEGHEVVRMLNPKSEEMGRLMKMKLVGFNNRKYDNHIVYAWYLGYTNEKLYQLSKKLISNDKNATFREAYNISYADIYEFSSKRQSLKKFEIELGLHHVENQYDWDKPLPEEHWTEVADYCANDVIATEAVFNARYSDFLAHEMLAELTGMTVNANGNTMATRLIFGEERNPRLVYVDLATGQASDPAYQRTDIINAFPGYEMVVDPETKKLKNMYRGTDIGFGGYVTAKPGMYTDIALIDIASMHPHSILAMNYLGAFTKNFGDLVDSRLHIKHKEYEAMKDLFAGRLTKYLEDEEKIGNLAYSLKIVINKIYGLTTAKFNNEFKDSRNVNNIVALRGALFMRTLQDEVENRGFIVAHIKTDSIKIPNATPEIIQFCMDFAKKYGYTFEHEATYDRMCLVNNAVYIAKYATAEKCQELYGYVPSDNKKHPGVWTPTGAQFAQPFIFKTLFSHEPIEFKDMCETKEVQTSMYLDYNENLPDVTQYEDELANRNKPEDKRKLRRPYKDLTDEELDAKIAEGHNYKFVGKIGEYTPIKSGYGGAELMAKRGSNKYDAVNGTKGYRWLESEVVKNANMEDAVDITFYRKLVDDAIANISQYGDFEWFVSNDPAPIDTGHPPDPDDVPWLMPCHDPKRTVCEKCEKHMDCPIVNALF